MKNRNIYTITLSLLAVAKLVLNAFGIDLLTNKNENDIANAVATIVSFIGIIMTHLKNRPKISFKEFVSNIITKFKKKPADIPVAVENAVKQVEPVVKTVETLTETKKAIAQAEPTKEEEPAAPIAPAVQASNTTIQK